MPDEMYLQWQFHHIYGRWLDLKNPKTYADKLAWLKIHEKDLRLTKLVDKYEVRDYVKSASGEKYLIPCYGVYNTTDEIPWNALPDQYVIKCTHDSGSVVLHRAGCQFDINKTKAKLNKHLKSNLYWYSREYPYKDVPHRIICEAFIGDEGNPPSDYKFLCFGGEPKFVILDMDRFRDHHRNCYDMNWEKQEFGTDHEQSPATQPKPEGFEEMKELARKLSKGFKHVRVDLYNVSGKIYFGEMTFFPWGGPIWFKPDSWNYKLGEMIELPSLNK